ncbi:MAG: ABC transporter ATP-binding protein [Methanomicrobiales archaeon]|nr:ABC transporter ATP-binding protein [Methanomicrobiales archaeon]
MAVATEELTRTFGAVVAVDHITFHIEEGEVFGLLGPNGAGKTTMVRLLNALIMPSAGKASVFGNSVAHQGDQVRSMTGVLTESPNLYERLSARRNLTFFGRLYGVPEADLMSRVEKTLSWLGLADRADDLSGTFSKGMKQRLALARALLHDPPLLFLDEPTSGLDPTAAREVDALIAELSRERGRTVLLCTHNLVEAQRLCDRVGVLARGRMIACGSVQELAQRLWSSMAVEIELLLPPPPGIGKILAAIPGLTGVEVSGTKIEGRVSSRDQVPEMVSAVVSAGGRVLRVVPREHTLEEIYFALQKEETA